MKIGYIRVSTQEQNEGRQIKLLEEHKVDKIYTDKQSGKNTNRPQLQEMLSFAREGDIIIVESISRLARNARDLLNIVEQIREKGVQFISLKENIDTDTLSGKFMLTVFAAMAELERGYILERQREGIEIAKAQGKYAGRKPIDINKDEFKRICRKWCAGEITATTAMKQVGLKPNTFYRRANELGFNKKSGISK